MTDLLGKSPPNGKSTCFFATWTVNFAAKIGPSLTNITTKIEDENKASQRKDAEKRGLLHHTGVCLRQSYLIFYLTLLLTIISLLNV